MPLRIDASANRLTHGLAGAAYAMQVELRGDAPRVLALRQEAALRVASALRASLCALMNEGEFAGGADCDLLVVAVPDAALASHLESDEDFGACIAEVVEACVQDCARATAGPLPETGFVEGFAIDRQGPARLAALLQTWEDEPTDSVLLPVFVVTDEARLPALHAVMTERVGTPAADGELGQAIAAALRPHRIELLGPPVELGMREPEDDGLADEDLPFVYMASRQETEPGSRALHDPDDLVEALPAMQRKAAQSGEPQFAYSRGVAVVASADVIYLGFKTVDDLGRQAEIERREAGEEGVEHADADDDDGPAPGERIAQTWIDWYLHAYQPVMGAVTDAGLRALAFPVPAWSSALAGCIATDAPFRPGTGELRPLEEVHVETSDHDLDETAEGAFVVTRVVIFDPDEEDAEDGDDVSGATRAVTTATGTGTAIPNAGATDVDDDVDDADEDDEDEPTVLCAAVRVVAVDGTGVAQQNLYATKSAGMVDLSRYVEQFMNFPSLPIRPGIQNLVVCDEHLRLMLPVDPSELEEDGDATDGDEDEEDLPDLKAMRVPPRGGSRH
jgi:hypothetical protein